MNDTPTSIKPDILPQVDVPVWKDRLEMGSKIGLSILGVSYGTGLIILNLHVRNYGINYLNFLQVEYIMVGLLWMFLVGGTYVASSVVIAAIKEIFKTDHSTHTKIRRVTLKSALIFLAVISVLSTFNIFFIQMLSDWELSIIRLNGLIAMGVLLGNAGLIYGLVSVIKDATRFNISPALRNAMPERKRRDLVFTIFTNTVGLFIMLSLYAAHLFPYIPSSYGGGRREGAEIILKEEFKQTAGNLGFVFLPESRNIGEQNIIFEAPDFFLLEPPNGHGENVKAIRMRKEMIDAIFYVSRKKPVSK